MRPNDNLNKKSAVFDHNVPSFFLIGVKLLPHEVIYVNHFTKQCSYYLRSKPLCDLIVEKTSMTVDVCHDMYKISVDDKVPLCLYRIKILFQTRS